jgi:hypothetical protein
MNVGGNAIIRAYCYSRESRRRPMATNSIRVRAKSYQALKEMAAAAGQSLQDVLDQTIKRQQRQLYMEGVAADYAALARNPKALVDFKKEAAL